MAGTGPRQGGVNGLRLGSFAGAPIIIDSSFALTALLFVGLGLINGGLAALPNAFVFIGVLIVAVFVHELAHAGIGAALGHKSKVIAMTFFGGHVEFVVPPKKRWHDMAISAAGPLANIAFAVAAMAVLQRLAPHWTGSRLVLQFLDVSIYVNLLLGAFNLLPGFPLDGGRILKSGLNYFMSAPRARLVAAIGGLIIAAAAAYYGASRMYLWTLMIAFFLGLSAWSEARAARAALQGAGGSSGGGASA